MNFRKRLAKVNKTKTLRLFKYIPEKYLESFIETGEILFRSLSYFQQGPESDSRTDQFDGKKQYAPDTPFSVFNKTQGKPLNISEMLDPVDSERVFVFCASTSLKKELYERFECEVCVEIKNPLNFIQRIEKQLKTNFELSELFHKEVSYYIPNKNKSYGFRDPYKIPFLKRKVPFSIEDEYRMFFVEGPELEQKRKLTIAGGQSNSKSVKLPERDYKIEIGSIKEYSVVHRYKGRNQFTQD